MGKTKGNKDQITSSEESGHLINRKRKPVQKSHDSDNEGSSNSNRKKGMGSKKVESKGGKKPSKKSHEDSDSEGESEKGHKRGGEKKKHSSDSEDLSEDRHHRHQANDDESEDIKPVSKSGNNHSSQSKSGHNELFVKNLSFKSSEDSLYTFFGEYGEVENVKMLTDRNTGRSKGIAFVRFASADSAKAVIDAGQLELDGRSLTCDYSNNKETSRRSGGDYNNNRESSSNYTSRPQKSFNNYSDYNGEKYTIFVGNLGFRTSEQNVSKFFSECGNVVGVRIAKGEDGRSRGFCHVDFDSKDAVDSAMGFTGRSLDGREIRVDESTAKSGGGNRDRGGRGGRGGGYRGGRGGGRGGNSNSYDRGRRSGGSKVTFGDESD